MCGPDSCCTDCAGWCPWCLHALCHLHACALLRQQQYLQDKLKGGAGLFPRGCCARGLHVCNGLCAGLPAAAQRVLAGVPGACMLPACVQGQMSLHRCACTCVWLGVCGCNMHPGHKTVITCRMLLHHLGLSIHVLMWPLVAPLPPRLLLSFVAAGAHPST